jgi:hypothetical protein
VASFRMSEDRLRGGVGAATLPGVTAAGRGERILAAPAAPAASSAASASGRVERIDWEAGGVGVATSRAGAGGVALGKVGAPVSGIAGADMEGTGAFVTRAGWAVTRGSGDVAGRFAPVVAGAGEGRRAGAGMAASGVSCAVGASPEEAGFLVVAAGRGGTVGIGAGESGGVAVGGRMNVKPEVEADGVLGGMVTDAVGRVGTGGAKGAGCTGAAEPVLVETWGAGDGGALIGCWGGRGVSEM